MNRDRARDSSRAFFFTCLRLTFHVSRVHRSLPCSGTFAKSFQVCYHSPINIRIRKETDHDG